MIQTDTKMPTHFQPSYFQTQLFQEVNKTKTTKTRGGIFIDTERCKGCNLCVIACPVNTLSLSNETNAKGYSFSQVSSPETCVGCAACALVCPDACIKVYKVRIQQ